VLDVADEVAEEVVRLEAREELATAEVVRTVEVVEEVVKVPIAEELAALAEVGAVVTDPAAVVAVVAVDPLNFVVDVVPTEVVVWVLVTFKSLGSR
jgi:hypothetical protein